MQGSHFNFQEIFVSPKMAALLNFRIFLQKIAKDKNAYISKTMLDRVILTKLLTHRVSLQINTFIQKIFVLPKMAAVLNFSQKLQNTKMLVSRNLC